VIGVLHFLAAPSCIRRNTYVLVLVAAFATRAHGAHEVFPLDHSWNKTRSLTTLALATCLLASKKVYKIFD
jgi:hypothetical protein